jgi:hypothetical protein
VNGSEHYREGERLLSDASFIETHGYPVKRDGSLFQPGEHEALIARATAHFAAAQAAATALEPVTWFAGDSAEITEWARITGLFPPRDGVRSRACEFENHRTCAGCGCDCHKPAHTCVPFDPPEERRDDCQRCRDEAAKDNAS